MKKSIFAKLMLGCSFIFLLTSCTKEDISTEQLQPELSQAELYLYSHDVPAIMFSYNVLNTDTKLMHSLLIDDEGQLRTNTKQAFEAREMSASSGRRLELMKEESKVIDDLSVTLDELLQHFNLMRTAEIIDYDKSIEKEGPQIITTTYAYYYNYARAISYTGNNRDCGGEYTSTTQEGGSTGSFASILLEQKLAQDIIQKNDKSNFTIDWFHNLVNASSVELANN